uniref:Uncharacterized protein n=1 Tax=Spongospora subterranea TaxID=70186 RepID=A0A0H5QYX7_9EUKA|eukprot:CRZ00769.1 hypothetical protein [Spongospora subterranea]
MINNPGERDSTTSTETSLLDGPLDDKYQDLINEGRTALEKVKIANEWKIIISYETMRVIDLIKQRCSLSYLKDELYNLTLAATCDYGPVIETSIKRLVSSVLGEMKSIATEDKQREGLMNSLQSIDQYLKNSSSVADVRSSLTSVCCFYKLNDQVINVLSIVNSELNRSVGRSFKDSEVFWNVIHELTAVVVSSGKYLDQFTTTGFALVVALLRYFLNMVTTDLKPVQ